MLIVKKGIWCTCNITADIRDMCPCALQDSARCHTCPAAWPWASLWQRLATWGHCSNSSPQTRHISTLHVASKPLNIPEGSQGRVWLFQDWNITMSDGCNLLLATNAKLRLTINHCQSLLVVVYFNSHLSTFIKHHHLLTMITIMNCKLTIEIIIDSLSSIIQHWSSA